ncbi:hypothetical protein [Bradyrhizobium betae]|uniref:Uncharacterized protein n=1 Tax=Bradyrhizobium betae TaxID=244734 RepID=A0A5P6P8W2_9BRAD|nr:hypothetical protein [Bradyrhizobium betae]MCS3729348.1 hypothetical protein [Bradyrhizobium betae]QFI73873.1 hypothetical protein F8237_16520 [Bradyrhizobium betae]
MADWEFEELPASLVEQEPTQRDQFNNDDVELAEALVREVIQNSTDAPAGAGAVKVRFAIRSLGQNQTQQLGSLFANLRPHLQVCGVDASAIDQASVRVLVIEDFNTRGLTGNPEALDGENFHNFWRRHGKSGKGGKQGGRWGLGKLVFSTSSQIRSFFGLTLRSGDAAPLFMGQAVLSNHVFGGKRRAAHGFWFGARGIDRLQHPVSDAGTVQAMRALLGIARTTETGLSIAIPYPNQDITEQSIIGGVVRNYYFPILAGRLVVEVGSVLIDDKTFHKVAAATSSGGGAAGARIPLGFVEEVSNRLGATPPVNAQGAINGNGLAVSNFVEADIASMKSAFAAHKLLHVRVPVRLKPKAGGDANSFIDLFLKPLPDGEKPFALFVRGAITVPGENRYFSGTHAYGAMVASDGDIVDFLGDAENPAHTAWNANAEKLSQRWRSPAQTLRHVRYALRDLYSLVAERVEQEDRDALVDFFSLADKARSVQGPKKRVKVVVPVLPKRAKAISIQSRKGGFTIAPGPGASAWTYPKTVDVRVAYDIVRGDGFKAHSRLDFDLNEGELEIELKNADVTPVRSNKLRLLVASPDFGLTVSGFDENRDLLVDARTV